MESETQPPAHILPLPTERQTLPTDTGGAMELLVRLVTRGGSWGRIRKALSATPPREVIATVDTILDQIRQRNDAELRNRLQLILSAVSDETFLLLFSAENSKLRLRRMAAAGFKLPFDQEAIGSAGDIVAWQSAIGCSIAAHLNPRTWRPFLDLMEPHLSYLCRDTLLLWQSLWRALSGSVGPGCGALHYVDALAGITPMWQARLTVAALCEGDSAAAACLTALATTGFLHDSELRGAVVALGKETLVRDAFRESIIPPWRLRDLDTPVISRLHFRSVVTRHHWSYKCALPIERAGLLIAFGLSLSYYNPTVIEHAADAESFLAMIDSHDLVRLYQFVEKAHRNEVVAILTAGDEHLFETRTEHDLEWLVDHRAEVVNHCRSRGIEERFVFPKLFQYSAELSQ